MITRPKQRAWKLVALVVSTVVLFLMLSDVAVAQDIVEVPVEDTQSANQYIDDLSTTALTLQAEPEPIARGAITAEPSESPWMMDQQRFDAAATPAQIANGVEPISEANQPLMQGDLSTIASVQEPLPPMGAESATIEPVTEVPETSSATPEESAANNASATTSELVASDPVDSTWRYKTPSSIYERRLLGVGIIVVSFAVLPGLIVLWKQPHVRVSVLGIIGGKSKQARHIRVADPKKSGMLRAEWTTDMPRRCRRHHVKHALRRRDHRKYKDL